MGKIYGIEIMHLSARLERIFLRKGIKTANDLFQYMSKDYLLSFRGIGQKSLDEIEKSVLNLMHEDKQVFLYLENLPRKYPKEVKK